MWAVYYKGKDLAIINVPFHVAQQIARQDQSATVITADAAGRVKHRHELGATVCRLCAGESVPDREVVTI